MSASGQQSARRLLAEVIHPRLSLFDERGTVERRAALIGHIAAYAVVTAVVLTIAGIEVARWYFQSPPQPLVFGLAAALLTGYAGVRVALILPMLRTLSREQQARRSLRAAIDHVCSRGGVLFDGLTDARGHLLGSVLATSAGLFTIIARFVPRGSDLSETLDHIDPETVMIGGHPVMADPIGQARRAARALYELLAAENLTTVPVQPIVVFPGWTIGRRPAGDTDVRVTTDRDLADEIAAEPAQIDAKSLIAVSQLLERLYLRHV